MKRFVKSVLCIAVMLCGGCSKQSEEIQVVPGEYTAFEKPVSPEDVVYEEGVHYVKSQILVTAVQDAEYNEVKDFLKKHDGTIVGFISITNDYQVEMNYDVSRYDLLTICNELEKSPLIEKASLNYAFGISDNGFYENDPWQDTYGDAKEEEVVWDEMNPDGTNWWAEAVGMPSVWDSGEKFETVKVGIIDTMFDLDQADLKDVFKKTWANPHDEDGSCTVGMLYANSEWNIYAGDTGSWFDKVHNDEKPDHLFWHGTHVAGIIGAKGNNNFGITGINQNVELYGYSVSSGLTEENYTDYGTVFAFEYCIAEMLNCGVKVINLSMGYEELLIAACNNVPEALAELNHYKETLTTFLKKCLRHGYDFLIVEAAGNESRKIYTMVTPTEKHPYGYDPGKYKIKNSDDYSKYDAKNTIFGCIDDPEVMDHILIVGAAELHNKRDYWVTQFSNGGDRVDVYAPGKNVLSLFPMDEVHYSDGTSMAAPIVTGICSLVWGINPELTGAEVKSIVISSQNIVPYFDYRETPVVNAKYAVDLAGNYPTSSDQSERKTILLGIVRDTQDPNNPQIISDAVVSLKQDGETMYEAESTEEGFVCFARQGTYTLEIDAEGYEKYEQTITLSDLSETCFVDLTSERSEYLDELLGSYWYFSAHYPFVFSFHEDGTFDTLLIKENFDTKVSAEISPSAISDEKSSWYGNYRLMGGKLILDIYDSMKNGELVESGLMVNRFDYTKDGNVSAKIVESYIKGFAGTAYYYETGWKHENKDDWPLYMLQLKVADQGKKAPSASTGNTELDTYLNAFHDCLSNQKGCEAFGGLYREFPDHFNRYQYDLIDVDGNGVKEFILRAAYPYDDSVIWAYESVHTIKPGNQVELVIEPVSIERGFCNIYDNSMVAAGGSGGAAYYNERLYKYQDGFLSLLQEYNTTNETYETHPDHPYMTKDSVYLSYDEMNADIDKLTGGGSVIEPDWKDLP